MINTVGVNTAKHIDVPIQRERDRTEIWEKREKRERDSGREKERRKIRPKKEENIDKRRER